MGRQLNTGAWGTIASLVVACFASITEAQTCLRTPISVPIKNVTITGGARGAISRGMAISVGTPPQSIAFMPSLRNNTFVYNGTNLCRQIYEAQAFDSEENCVLFRGGAYTSASSTTRKNGNAAAVAADPGDGLDTITNSDTLIINNTKLDDFTLSIPSKELGGQFYTPQAGLGLGRDSTFLKSLKDKGQIASRSYSIFWGRTGRDYASRSDGNVVFGGYDKSKVQATNYTQKLNYTNCLWGLSIKVTYLGLKFKDNTETNLFNATSPKADSQVPLYACIDPGYPGTSVIPYYDYFKNFVAITKYLSFSRNALGGASIRSHGYNFWNLLYRPGDSPYEGDLKMIFEDTVSIWMDNNELVTPHVYLDDRSHTFLENGTQSDLRINADPAQDAGSRMRLGRNALTFLYLMVNHDAGTFTIWQAVDDGSPENLQAIDGNNNPIASSSTCADSTTPGGSSGGGAASSPSPSTPTNPNIVPADSKMSTGAIAGIAVGGVAVVALIILGILFFIRRGRKKQAAEGSGGVEPPYWTPEGTNDSGVVHEAGVQEVGGGAGGYYAPKYSDQVLKPAELGGQNPVGVPGQAYHEMPTN